MRCEKCGNEIPSFAVYCPYCGAHVDDTEEPTDYEYEAFISYRHLPQDRAAATRIQRLLEGANIPKELRNPPEKKRMGKLFRDEDELTATESLSDTIVEALKKSRYLIVVCTPDTRKSDWVLREVETFAALHGRDHVLTALAAGEPSESFPPLLLSRWVPDEETGAYHEIPSEPLAANLRPENKRGHSREVIRLQATMLGCGYDDLQQRIRMRRMRMNVAIAVALMLAGLAFGVFALAQRAETQIAYYVALRNESELLAREFENYLNSGKRIEALRSAYDALPTDDDDRVFVPEAQLALERALDIFPRTTPWVAYSIDGVSKVYDSCDGIQATVEYGSTVVLSDTVTGAKKLSIGLPKTTATDEEFASFTAQIVLGLKFGDGTLVCKRSQTMNCFDVETGKELWSIEADTNLDDVTNILYLKNSHQFVISTVSMSEDKYALSFLFYDEKTGQLARTVTIEDAPTASYPRLVAVSPDERYIAALLENYGVTDSGSVAGIALFANEPTEDRAPQILIAPCSRKHGRDIDFVNDAIVVVCADDTEYPDEDTLDDAPTVNVSYECFDLTLNRLWKHDEACEYQLVDGEYHSAGDASVVGVVTEGLDPSPQIVCTCNDAFMTLEAATGDLYRWVPVGAPLAGAILAGDAGEFCVAGCTNDGDVFVRSPLTNTLKKDAMLHASFSQSISFAHPIMNGGEFAGFAAWDNESRSYLIFMLDDLAGRGTQRSSTNVDGSVKTNGSNLVVTTTDSIVMVDPNKYEALWTVKKSSLDLGDSKIRTLFTPTSVIAYSVEETNDTTLTLRLAELSNKDGSVVVAWSIPWSNTHGASPESLWIVDYNKRKDDKRFVAITDLFSCEVVDLDTQEKVLEVSDEGTSATMFADVMLAQDSLIIVEEAGSFERLEHFSLETGDEIGGYLSQAAIENMLVTSTIAFLDEDRSVIAVRCLDGVVRAYNTHDGSYVWSSDPAIKNIQFLCRANDEYFMVQDFMGCCCLLKSSDGQCSMSSNVTFPVMQSCERPDDGSGTVILSYKPKGAGGTSSLVMFAWGDSYFGPISEVNYGVLFSPDGKSVLIDAPWNDDFIVYERLSREDMMKRAKELIDSYDGDAG
ncbi:MAG: TIR domain-containing protein [Atopobiaceae bacterium]|nr:TIR domain-containing protein [Atopobiaceae bacterium]